jgi:hypothetical protein
VYFVYGRDAEWKGDPRVLLHYQHQLRSLPSGPMLDGDKPAGEIRKLLPE